MADIKAEKLNKRIMSSQQGETLNTLRCVACKHQMAVAPDDLPKLDTLPVTCPACQHTEKYHPSKIDTHTVTVSDKQKIRKTDFDYSE